MNWHTLLKTATPIAGGLTHQVVKVLIDETPYALKILNPFVMAKKGALTQLLASEKIARYFKSQGLPAVCALAFEGQLVQHWGDQALGLVYPWIPGKPRFYPDFGAAEVTKIATLLAKMHALGTVSHRDFDPKNVLWVHDAPFIIDWEAAGPIQLMEELVALAYEWSGFERGFCDLALFQLFFEQYEQAGGLIISAEVDQGLQGFIRNYEDWLRFNLARKAETQNPAEHVLAEQQIALTERKLQFLKTSCIL